MNFDFESFCQDNSVDHSTEGSKHTSPGWIQMECPFCSGNPGHHLGFNIVKGYFNCWRCGFHPMDKVVSSILNCSTAHAKSVIKNYRGEPSPPTAKKEDVKRASKLVLPIGCDALYERHFIYLAKRQFNGKKLASTWNLLGTGPVGPYKFRIIAPIYHMNRMVSYQGRDITGKSPLRYKACKKEDEVRDHKHCLYGLNKVDGDSVVVVEGITDVWRLGPGAVATFGIEYTPVQVSLLKKFKNAFILFDTADPQAVTQAFNLGEELNAFGVEVEVIEITGSEDPASMPQREADILMKELLS